VRRASTFVRRSATFVLEPVSAEALFVECESESEIDRLYAALGEGGSTLMPINNYGFCRRFAWVNDRFGVSWQLNLS
jgi:predicted 3-demethylubiquinone-9 3-methyltransferase (glyoxalase superfamily)